MIVSHLAKHHTIPPQQTLISDMPRRSGCGTAAPNSQRGGYAAARIDEPTVFCPFVSPIRNSQPPTYLGVQPHDLAAGPISHSTQKVYSDLSLMKVLVRNERQGKSSILLVQARIPVIHTHLIYANVQTHGRIVPRSTKLSHAPSVTISLPSAPPASMSLDLALAYF